MTSPQTDEMETLQARLEAVADVEVDDPEEIASAEADVANPSRLLHHFEASGRFHRDPWLGRIFHPGRVSLRENRPHDSLHIVVHHNHLAAHVDRVSPLGLRPESRSRYSMRRAAAHNVAGLVQEVVQLALGRQGDHRSELDCEWVWDSNARVTEAGDLLDPTISAWSVHLEARVSGSLDEPRLREALGAVLRRETSVHDPITVVDCPDDESLDVARRELQSMPVGMSAWPPLRARLARSPDGDVLMLNVNHGAADGVGALRVLQAIAQAYAGDGDAEPPDFLAARELPARPTSAPVSATKARYRAMVERFRDALARPALIAPEGAEDEPGFGFHLVRLSVEDTQRVLNSGRPGTSRNILLAGLHLAIGDWNLRHGTPGRRIGVLVPVNLRPEGWREETVGNFTVTARVATSRRHRAGAKSVLKAITAQTTRNKRIRTGTALLEALDRSSLLPLWAQQSLVVLQPLTRNRLVDTAMLANLGWLDDAPSFGPDAGETTDIWFSAPARAPQTLCIGAVTVGGRLHLTFRYPHHLFGDAAAGEFADGYIARIRSVAAQRW